MQQPTAEAALAAMEPLIGEWQVTASGPDGAAWPGDGRMTIAWHESRAHLVLRSHIDVPGAPDSVSIIGCDVAQGRYYELYADERGVCRVYEMSIDAREWRRWRDGEPFPQRFVGRLERDRIEARWEKAVDAGSFELDFSMTFVRVAGGAWPGHGDDPAGEEGSDAEGSGPELPPPPGR